MFDCHLSFSDAPSARTLQEKIARSATTDDKWQLNNEQFLHTFSVGDLVHLTSALAGEFRNRKNWASQNRDYKILDWTGWPPVFPVQFKIL
jgi:hypothetical protein